MSGKTPATTEEIFEAQKAYFRTGSTLPVKKRINALKQLRKSILENEQEIFLSLNADLNKSAFESYATEIGFVLEEIRTHIKNLRNWTIPEKSSTPITNFPASSYTVYEPLGTVLIIAPWNYPFQLLIAPLIGAISAGNTAILKPSEISVNTSTIIKDLISKTFSNEYICVLEGGKEVTQSLLKQKFDHIFFTGSPGVGRIIAQEAAKHLTPVTLELGGKSPCIVDSTANIKLAAKRIIWGKLLNAGQTCIAPDYLLVNSAIKDKLIEELRKAIIKYYGEDASQCPDYPRIITRANVERLANLIEKGNVVYGGKHDANTKYFEPTIIDDVKPEDAIMQQEIFGPLLPVLTYNKLSEAIEFVTSRPKPLALYFFSRCTHNQKQIVKSISAGGVTINDTIMHIASNKLPFGGVGNSGIGKYHGKHSFTTFSNAKPVVYKKNWLDIPLRYAPFKNKLGLVKLLMR